MITRRPIRGQPYRVTALTADGRVTDITVLRRTIREAFYWAHLTMPDSSSITIEAPRT